MTEFLARILTVALMVGTVVFTNPILPIFAEEVATPPAETPAPSGESTTVPDAASTSGTSGGTASGDAVIVTGDAASVGDTTTSANTNDTNVGGGTTGGTTGGIPVGATPVPSETTTTTTNDNTAAAATDSTVTANTGNNTADASAGVGNGGGSNNQVTTAGTEEHAGASASAGGGNATVVTGNAYAAANVINVLNTNIFNSNGFFLFLNSFFGGGTLDLSKLDFLSAPESAPTGTTYCSLGGCPEGGASYVMMNNNTATIDNAVVVRSNTGGNAAAGDGNATIATGNAYAAANVVNVANSNFVDSNYLLLSFNNFGNMDGDIVLPNSDFFAKYFHGGALSTGASNTVTNTNTAAVTNTVGVTADTGNNSASSNGGNAVIATGNSSANGAVTNLINTNEFGGDKVFMLFRVFGNWAGNIYNAPAGIEWAPTATGVELFSIDTDTAGGSANPLQNLKSLNSNSATVKNDVQVYALTGDNRVDAGTGNGTVVTGDAYAAANVTNVVNTNVVGRNWIFAIFNIFGDFNGSISFGRPDLWLGAVADSNGHPYGPGQDVTYTFTVTNHGDADASNVHLKAAFNHNLLQFMDGDEWDLGALAKNQTVEVVKHAKVTGSLGVGDTPIPVDASVSLHESDADMTDNYEEVTIVGQYYPTGMIGAVRPGPETPDPIWKLKKTVSTPTTVASSTVDYAIQILNDGGPAYNAVLFDSVTDSDGDVVFEQSWDLGMVQANEEINVTYSVFFHDNIPAGVYTNHAFIRALGRSPAPQYAVSKDSGVVSAVVTITAPVAEGADQPEVVLAPEEPRSCDQYIYESIRSGARNNPEEVRKLQNFLNKFAGFTGIGETGIYDKATEAAVKKFQEENTDEVLSPWGLDGPTGYVYITTRKKINDIYCQGQAEFPLSDGEVTEINGFKGYLMSLRALRIKGSESVLRMPPASVTNPVPVPEEFEGSPSPTTSSETAPSVVESATTSLIGTTSAIFGKVASTALDSIAGAAGSLDNLRQWLASMAGSLRNILSSLMVSHENTLGSL